MVITFLNELIHMKLKIQTTDQSFVCYNWSQLDLGDYLKF